MSYPPLEPLAKGQPAGHAPPGGICMLIAVGWFACMGELETDTGTPPLPTDSGAPDSVAVPTPNRVACAVAPDNALRVSCTVDLDFPAAITLDVADTLGLRAAQRLRSDTPAVQHALTVTMLVPNQEYTVTVTRDDTPDEPVEGTFHTPVLAGGADMYITPAGPGPAPLLGMVSPCSTGAVAVIVDPQLGVPVWYEDFSGGAFGFIEGASFTEDGTVLAVVDSGVQEVDLEGNKLLSLERDEDLEHIVHHDVFRRDGLTYALFSEEITGSGGQFFLDGFYVFDSGGVQVGEWHLSDHFLPPATAQYSFPLDVSHANSVWVGPDLTALVSFRHLSAIAKVDADPYSPTFGTLLWVLSTPTSSWPSDFVIQADVGVADFFMQHNVFQLDDGNLTFFDNRLLVTDPSRVVEVRIDEEAMQATIVQEWPLPAHCDFQGGAWRTPSGDPLATCAPARTAWQVDDAQAIMWTGQAFCRTGFGSYVPRFVPLEW